MIKTLLERSPLLWVTEIRLLGGVVAGFVILLFFPNRRKIIKSLKSAGSWGYTISGSFIGAYLAMMLWLAGMKYAQASIAAALNQTSNIFVFILSALILKEPINPPRVLGIILGVTGAILVTFG
jgi:drug/metabolite transporter (DMT)-like permease